MCGMEEMLDINTVHQGDCLELMREIPDKSVDMILCDLPYGTTACKWDVIIPFEPLWEQYNRIIKDNGAIVLFGSQPFTSTLVTSNIKMFRYSYVWIKSRAIGHLVSKYRPMEKKEDILIFGKNKINFYPIKTKREKICIDNRKKENVGGSCQHLNFKNKEDRKTVYEFKNPTTVLEFSNEHNVGKFKHPTQKPVALFEYLIKTYTNEGDLVLDNCAGSFTTAVACDNLKRNWICIEKEQMYCEVGIERINKNRECLNLPLLDNSNII